MAKSVLFAVLIVVVLIKMGKVTCTNASLGHGTESKRVVSSTSNSFVGNLRVAMLFRGDAVIKICF